MSSSLANSETLRALLSFTRMLLLTIASIVASDDLPPNAACRNTPRCHDVTLTKGVYNVEAMHFILEKNSNAVSIPKHGNLITSKGWAFCQDVTKMAKQRSCKEDSS